MIAEQEDWTCPVLEDWQAELDKALSKTEGAFLVAHSLGCLLAASYANRAIARKIRGALLVAPCSLDVTLRLHPCMIEFGEEPLEPLPFPSLVVGSVNDPYMRVPDLEHHVRRWGSELITIGFAGHINIASGFGRWPNGYALLERLKARAQHDRLQDALHACGCLMNGVICLIAKTISLNLSSLPAQFQRTCAVASSDGSHGF